jgi:hypothetical protein
VNPPISFLWGDVKSIPTGTKKRKKHTIDRIASSQRTVSRDKDSTSWRYAPEPKTRHRRCFSKTRAMVYQPYVNLLAHIKEIYPLKGSKQKQELGNDKLCRTPTLQNTFICNRNFSLGVLTIKKIKEFRDETLYNTKT